MKPRVTVFLATFNRLETLQRTLDSYRNLTTPYELVIVDNGTDHPDCLRLLEQAERRSDVSQIYTFPKIRTIEQLCAHLSKAMRDRYRQRRKPDWFAVTDADICFDGTDPGALDAYMTVAAATGKASGAHTRVDASIPHGYPLRSRVLACESRLLYRDSMEWLDGIPFSVWSTDTTFHLFPPRDQFKRLTLDTVRVGPPYAAMHLDWYADVFHPSQENSIYLCGRRVVSSWGSSWLKGFWQTFQVDRERAVAETWAAATSNHHDDFRNEWFILAWCYQQGIVEPLEGRTALESSRLCLDGAFPSWSPHERHRSDWLAMIYDQDFSSLGWDDA